MESAFVRYLGISLFFIKLNYSQNLGRSFCENKVVRKLNTVRQHFPCRNFYVGLLWSVGFFGQLKNVFGYPCQLNRDCC